ncbi:hypothetical protein AG1IA_06923 [Rhizoctonia solani AG-1 IA]|uniref:Uncharacterized protein n=1 Tax=Thanatephorus cucumeris (strain AG1-IA) TaxID=983506 RepID=L8WLL4_THACA|nr:hypothetical protein AG1IA_06923 [Rhizoctonia solani AG-1 IA]
MIRIHVGERHETDVGERRSGKKRTRKKSEQYQDLLLGSRSVIAGHRLWDYASPSPYHPSSPFFNRRCPE